jgi:hypothetical protein
MDTHHQGHQFIAQSDKTKSVYCVNIKKGKNLLVTLPAASLPAPETVDFWALRAAREVVICSMSSRTQKTRSGQGRVEEAERGLLPARDSITWRSGGQGRAARWNRGESGRGRPE